MKLRWPSRRQYPTACSTRTGTAAGCGWTWASGTAQLHIVVEDDGVGIADLDKAREAGVTSRPEDCMGLGFTFMAEYMDGLDVHTGPRAGHPGRLCGNGQMKTEGSPRPPAARGGPLQGGRRGAERMASSREPVAHLPPRPYPCPPAILLPWSCWPRPNGAMPRPEERFVASNVRLVQSIVMKFVPLLRPGRGIDPDDLFQVGCLGLLKAMEGFDLARNVRFSTYAVPVIAGEIRRCLREQHPVRVSRGCTTSP